MESSENHPIYVRNLTGINDDHNTPEGQTFIHFEAVLLIIIGIVYIGDLIF